MKDLRDTAKLQMAKFGPKPDMEYLKDLTSTPSDAVGSLWTSYSTESIALCDSIDIATFPLAVLCAPIVLELAM